MTEEQDIRRLARSLQVFTAVDNLQWQTLPDYLEGQTDPELRQFIVYNHPYVEAGRNPMSVHDSFTCQLRGRRFYLIRMYGKYRLYEVKDRTLRETKRDMDEDEREALQALAETVGVSTGVLRPEEQARADPAQTPESDGDSAAAPWRR